MEIRLTSETKFKGKIFDVRRDTVLLDNGKTAIRDIIEQKSDASAAVAIMGGDIILVKQFRYAIGRDMIEIPAGKIDLGEDPITCIARELKEEIGYKANKIIPLTKIYGSAGCLTEAIHVFYATDLKECKESADDDERIEVIRLPFKKAYEMVKNGEINDAKTIAGIMTVTRYID